MRQLRQLRAFCKAPGHSTALYHSGGNHGSSSDGNGSEQEFLLKLRKILLGNATGATTNNHKNVRDNAGLLSRLKTILVQEHEEHKDPQSRNVDAKEDVSGLVLYHLGKQGKVEAARAICQEMAQKVYVPDIVSLSSVFEHGSKLGTQFFQLPKGWDAGVPLHSKTMVALCRSGRFLDAQRAVVAMLRQGMEVDTMVLNTLIYGLCKAGYERKCLELVREMVNRGTCPDLLGEGVGLVVRVCRTFEGLLENGVCPDVMFYEALVDGLCKMGKMLEAFQIFRYSATNSFSSSSCKTLVDGLSEMGLNDEVCKTAEIILELGLIQGNAGFDAVINKLLKDGREELVMNMLRGSSVQMDRDAMLRRFCDSGKLSVATEFLVYESGRIHDMETYNGLLSKLCEVLVEKKAYIFLERLSENLKLQWTSTYSVLIRAFCEAGMLEEAYALLRGMRQKGCLRDSRNFSPLIGKLCEVREVEDAWLLLQEMTDEDHGESSRVSNLVLQTFYKAGKLEEAMEVVEWMLGKGFAPDVAAYNTLIKVFCEAGNVEQGVILYNEMFQRGCKAEIGAYNALLAGLWGSGKTKEGLVLFQQMVRKSVVPDATTCGIIIDGLCKEGKLDVGLRVLQLAPGLGCVLGLASYRRVLDGFFEQDDVERVRVVVKEMVLRGWEPDGEIYDMLFTRWDKTSGSEDEMQALFRDILRRNVTPSISASRAVLTRLCSTGKLDSAAEIIKDLSKMAVDESVFRTYIVSLCKCGRVEDARRAFENGLRGKCRRATFLAACLEAELESDAQDCYSKLLEDGHEATSVIADLMCCLEGDVSAAFKFIRNVVSKGNKVLVTTVVDQLVNEKKLTEARLIFVEMVDVIPQTAKSTAALKRLADALVQGRRAPEACKLLEEVIPIGNLCNETLCRRLVRDLLRADEGPTACKALEVTVQKRRPSTGFLNDVLRDFCKLRKFEEAASALEALHARGLLHSL